MKMLRPLLMLLCIFCFSKFSKAQDLLYKKDKTVILARVIEIGVDDVKYRDYNDPDGPIIGIAKGELLKLKLEKSRKEIFFIDNFDNPALYADNKKNAIKMDFLAPMFGQTTFAYERSIKPGASMEVHLGIIGVGMVSQNPFYDLTKANGFFMRAGYKFIKTPDYYIRGMRYSHILKGSYIKPEITFGTYSETKSPYPYYSYYTGSTTPPRDRVDQYTCGAIMINFGKQWVMNNIFLIDYFAGFGYGFT